MLAFGCQRGAVGVEPLGLAAVLRRGRPLLLDALGRSLSFRGDSAGAIGDFLLLRQAHVALGFGSEAPLTDTALAFAQALPFGLLHRQRSTRALELCANGLHLGLGFGDALAQCRKRGASADDAPRGIGKPVDSNPAAPEPNTLASDHALARTKRCAVVQGLGHGFGGEDAVENVGCVLGRFDEVAESGQRLRLACAGGGLG